MEKLFESYVAKGLAKVLDGEYAVTTQEEKLHLFDSPECFSLRPDIVVRGNNNTYILDTKWKLLSDSAYNNYGISQGDMYQMYAYHKKYQAKGQCVNGCFLLYPSLDKELKIGPFIADSGGVTVNIFFVDLYNMSQSMAQLKACFAGKAKNFITDSAIAEI